MNNKLIFLMSVLFLNVALAFATVTPSSLVQYGEHIDRERLHLLESQLTVQLTGEFSNIYIIHNTGGEYHATLGVFFYGVMTFLSAAQAEVQFFVDGRRVPHTTREHFGEFVMGETRVAIENFTTFSISWALIEVLFPENSTVTVQVQYRVRPGGRNDGRLVAYNTFSELGQLIPIVDSLDYWKGPTRFSLEIINQSSRRNGVEEHWITDVEFFHASDQRENIRTVEYLSYLQELETNLMRIQRLSGNTVRIDFTEEFMSRYHRSFTIDARWWTLELGALLSLWDNEIGLSFMQGIRGNITRRELSPYELIFFTNRQLRVIRNMFFARHGFIFQSEDLTNIFNLLERFYVPNPNFHDGMLTDIDRSNIAIIQRLEAMAGD